MNRTIWTVGGAVVALAAVTGVAAVAAPGEDAGGGGSVARKSVERTTLACPRPSDSDLASTAYTAFSPEGADSRKGTAELRRLATAELDGSGEGAGGEDGKSGKKSDAGHATKKQDDKPVLALTSPGTPTTASTERSDAPALAGNAEGRFAPGWTVQQTPVVDAGAGRGLHGLSCTGPDTSFWFPGVSTASERQDYVHLTNPDDTGAVVDLEPYGKDGRERATGGEGINIPPRTTVPVLLSALTSGPVENLALHVVARTGRVAAHVQADDEKAGGDWLPSAGDAAPRAVLPGIPGDATSVRLVVFAPGEEDADLKVRLAGPKNTITPAGYETLHVRGGMTTAVDLKDLTKGEAGSLVLSPSGEGGATPVVAAVRVTRGKGAKQETSFIPSTPAISQRATAADNRASGSPFVSSVSLTALGSDAKVKVTASKGSGGGSARSKTVSVDAGTTKTFTPPRPEGGSGAYAVTVEHVAGGEVFGSRMLAAKAKKGSVPRFTVQPLPDDGSTVQVPESSADLSVLNED